MATVKFRPELLTRDKVPGAGMVDEVGDQLVELGTRVRDLADDDASATVRPPLIAALNSLADARRFVWNLRDKWEIRARDLHTMLARAQESAAAQLPTSGWGSPGDLEAARAGARAKVTAEVHMGITTDLVSSDANAKKAGELADAVVSTLTAAMKAVESARIDADSPPELTVADLAAMSAWESRARGEREPMQFLIQKFQQCVDHEKDDKVKTLVPVAERLATEWLKTPPGKLKTEARFDRGLGIDPADPHTQAHALLRTIREWRAASEPPSIAAADEVIDGCRPIFEALLGASPRFLSAAERKRSYYIDPKAAGSPPEWPVDPAWPTRWLPPKGLALPGWSRPAGKLSSGMYARLPAAGGDES
jgi:hypothetical protein